MVLAIALTLVPAPQQEWTLLDRPEAQPNTFGYDTVRNRLVLVTQESSDGTTQVWERSGGLWHVRQPAPLTPPGRIFHASAWDDSGHLLLFGGRRLNAVAGGASELFMNDTWEWDGTAWTQLPWGGQVARESAAMVFNPATRSFVLFGGYIPHYPSVETWECDRVSWRLAAAGGPPGRSLVSMAFDPVRQRVVLFGGVGDNVGATWEWSGAVWQQISVAGPRPRYGAACATDWSRNRVLLYGGWDPLSRAMLSDTWEWDGTRWTMLDAGAGTVRRVQGSMAYDASLGLMVMGYGGGDDTGGRTGLADLWAWTGTQWVQLEDGPPRRDDAALAYDEASGTVVLFGGLSQAPTYEDTWILRGNRWHNPHPAVHPPGRRGHAMAYDPVRQEVVLFGGTNLSNYTGATELDDTWVWRNGQWTQKQPAHHPSARTFASMAFDRAAGRLVLFGTATNLSDDMWTWDGTDWTRWPVWTVLPMQRPSVAYDEQRRTIVLVTRTTFDGWTRTREWTGTAWRDLGWGPDMTGGRLVYDEQVGACLLIGLDRLSAQRQVWRWDGSVWTQHGAHPIQYEAVAMTYDKSRRRVVTFGGQYRSQLPLQPYANSDLSGETWFYRSTSLRTRTPEARLGAGAVWDLVLPGSAGRPFVLGLSQGTDGIPVLPSPYGAPVVWPLTADRLFVLTFGWPSLLGVLDGVGRATVTLPLPNDPALDGLGLFASALTLDPALRPLDVTPDVATLLLR